MPVEHLHVARVDAVGEARVTLDARTLRGHRSFLDVGDELHRVRVAHREHGELDGFAVHLQFLNERSGKPRSTHIHAHLAVGLEARPDRAAGRLDADLALRGQALGVRKLHDAARAVAALLDLAAVGVEDAVAEIGAAPARPLEHRDLVAADAVVPVSDFSYLSPCQREIASGAINDHKIVPGALHLRERQLHAERKTWQMRSTAKSSSSGCIGSDSTRAAASSLAGSASPGFAAAYAGCRCSGMG